MAPSKTAPQIGQDALGCRASQSNLASGFAGKKGYPQILRAAEGGYPFSMDASCGSRLGFLYNRREARVTQHKNSRSVAGRAKWLITTHGMVADWHFRGSADDAMPQPLHGADP